MWRVKFSAIFKISAAKIKLADPVSVVRKANLNQNAET